MCRAESDAGVLGTTTAVSTSTSFSFLNLFFFSSDILCLEEVGKYVTSHQKLWDSRTSCNTPGTGTRTGQEPYKDSQGLGRAGDWWEKGWLMGPKQFDNVVQFWRSRTSWSGHSQQRLYISKWPKERILTTPLPEKECSGLKVMDKTNTMIWSRCMHV